MIHGLILVTSVSGGGQPAVGQRALLHGRAGVAPMLGAWGLNVLSVLQVADNLPLYGVCCYMDELVARPPSVLRAAGEAAPALPQFLVAAPRCYCLLTHYPFFPLHMKASTIPYKGECAFICNGGFW